MKRRFWLALSSLLALAPAVRAEEPALTATTTDTTWTVKLGDQVVCLYTFAPDQKKPYVKELAAPGSANILRDAPADHLHHHGLMYAIRVNNANFWEETPEGGVEKHVEVLGQKPRAHTDGRPVMVFRHRLHWIPAPAPGEPALTTLLVEDRDLAVSLGPERRYTMLVWRSTFEVLADRVTLHGSNYNGLGLRFREDLDSIAVPRMPHGSARPEGNEQLIQAGTSAGMNFPDAPEGPVAVDLVPHPTNPGTSTFFAMTKPFAYLSATQALDQSPLEYRKGDRYSLTYVIIVKAMAPGHAP